MQDFHELGRGVRGRGSLIASGCHARPVIGAGYVVSYGSAARAATNAGAFGVPHPVVAS